MTVLGSNSDFVAYSVLVHVTSLGPHFPKRWENGDD